MQDALHVLWTDEDNEQLVENFYPEFASVYNSFAMTVQKCDLVRLLYLHHFAGLYADLDYETHGHVWRCISNSASGNISVKGDVFAVESPVLFNEVMQNSLMIAASPGHPFFYEVAQNIIEIWTFLMNPDGCKVHNWQGCNQMWYFAAFFIRDVAFLLTTLQITGPAVLDKTFVRSRFKNYRIAVLGSEEFFYRRYRMSSKAYTEQYLGEYPFGHILDL